MTRSSFRSTLTLPALLVLGSLLSAQAPAEGKTLGGLWFPRFSHDFGKIRDEQPVTGVFKFTNRGTKPVTLKEVKASCGCLVPALPKMTFAPGESGEIAFNFDPKMRQGRDKKIITLVADESPPVSLELSVFADVIPRIGIEPRSLFIGEFKKGVPSEPKRITITSRLEGAAIASVDLDHPLFSWTKVSEEACQVDGVLARRYVYEVMFKGDTTIQRHQTQAVVTTTDPKVMPQVSIAILADVIGDLRILPDRLNLRLDTGGAPWTQEVRLSTRSQKAFKILSAEIEGPSALELKVTIAADPTFMNGQKLVVSGINPKTFDLTKGNNVEGKIHLKTDVPEQESFTIPVHGYVFAMPNPPAAGASGTSH